MICARCDQPIRDDEPSEPIDYVSASAGGQTVIVHAVLCKRAPTQTTPQGDRRRRG